MEVASWNQDSPLLESVGEKVTLEGIVVREPDVRTRVVQLTVRVEEDLVLVSTDRFTPVSYGDSVTVIGQIEVPEAFETDLGRMFDYKGYLKARGTTFVVPFAKVEVTDSGKGNKIISSLLSFKHAFIQKLEAAIPYPYVGLGTGLLLGVKQSLGESLEEAFRTAGIMHIVVLSGYNMMIVIMFVSSFLAFFFPQRVQLFFGAIAICAFTLMVGLGASVVRASVMALLVLLAQATGRTYAVLRALFAVGVLMLLLNPYLLVYDVGFQLSFIATLGLIVVAPAIERYALFMPSIFGLRGFLITTVAVQIFVTPILLYQIGEFSIVAVFVNLAVLPMVAPAMLLTFLTGVLGFFHAGLGTLMGYFAYLSLGYIITIAEFASSVPFAAVAIPKFPFAIVVISYGLLGYWLWRLRQTPEVTESEELQESQEDFSKWTIVDEATLKTKSGQSLRDCPPIALKTETPIFFR
jgi:competence protein ComEC